MSPFDGATFDFNILFMSSITIMKNLPFVLIWKCSFGLSIDLGLMEQAFKKNFFKHWYSLDTTQKTIKKGRSNYHTDHQKIRKMNSIVNVNLRQQFTSVWQNLIVGISFTWSLAFSPVKQPWFCKIKLYFPSFL